MNASTINPFAGSHPIVTDERILAPALTAGRITFRLVPYYPLRYGARGRLFARSDSAWLATLPAHFSAERQLAWLARVLAARGMPSALLEVHLEVLARVLSHRVPSLGSWGRLRELAGGMADGRRQVLADDALAALAHRFADDLGGRHPLVVGAGHLIGMAVVDEALARPNAVASLVDWLGDPATFGQLWSDRVDDAVDRTREAIAAG